MQMNRELLEKPFAQIHYRTGSKGRQFAYLEGYQVVKRMDEAFGGHYDFEILKWEMVSNEILVHGAITVRLEDGIIRKENIGSSEVRINKTTGELEGFGDAFKAAATDAFKRCAAFGFGVGLYLYNSSEETSEHPPATPHGNRPIPIQNPLSQAQKNALYAIGKAKNIGPKAIEEMALKEYGCPVESISKIAASKLIQILQGLDTRKAG